MDMPLSSPFCACEPFSARWWERLFREFCSGGYLEQVRASTWRPNCTFQLEARSDPKTASAMQTPRDGHPLCVSK